MLVIVSEKSLKIYDFINKEIISQFQTSNFFDEMLQNLKNEDEIVGINNGTIHFLSLSEEKTVRTISTATKSRCIIQLKSGQFILRNNDGTNLKTGEIFIIDEEDKAKMINTSGHIFSLCALDQAEFAIGKNQSI